MTIQQIMCAIVKLTLYRLTFSLTATVQNMGRASQTVSRRPSD